MVASAPATALPAHVLERADMRDALARHDFGTVFALARKWAGISYSKIAEACDIKPERVGTLARGDGRITSFEKIATIADALRIPGSLIGLASRSWEGSRVAGGGNRAEAHDSGDDPVFRREFLKSTALGASIALGAPLLDSSNARIGSGLAPALRVRTARLRRLDNILGGGDTYQIYLREFETTQAIIRNASYSQAVRRDLLSVLAEQAQQAGWAAFDAGDGQKATRLYKTSLQAAKEGGDQALAGNALAFLAYQHIGTDPAEAVRLATASCQVAGASLTGAVGALLHERRAWAYAVVGDAGNTERALEMARRSLTENHDSPRDWALWVDEDEIQIMSGRCWTELKRPLRSVPTLCEVLTRFNDDHARDKALYMTWLADAYLTAGEVEESAAVAGKILDLSEGVASVRPRQQLGSVLVRLAEYRDVPGVAGVLERTAS
ncbi:helix-turn-helix domain-containing protein [Micromonospora taraxaci]